MQTELIIISGTIFIGIAMFLVLIGQEGCVTNLTSPASVSETEVEVERSEAIELAKQCLELNEAKGSFKSAEKINLVIEGPARVILLQAFPNLAQYFNNPVWEIRWQGETENIEYVILIDSEVKEIVCAYSINKTAAPGVMPLKIKKE